MKDFISFLPIFRKQPISEFYDEIAGTYDRDYQNVLAMARKINLKQILRIVPQPISRVLDVCMGTGRILQELMQNCVVEQCIGNELSPQMLKIAEQKLPKSARFISGNALDLPKKLPAESQDLILMHFLLSYCNRDDAISMVHTLLKPGGYLSFASSTKESGREVYEKKYPFLQRVLNVRKALEQSYIPESHEENVVYLENRGFRLAAEEHYRQELIFSCMRDLWVCCYETGWLASWFQENKVFKEYLAKAVFKGLEMFSPRFYPFTATIDITVVTVQKI